MLQTKYISSRPYGFRQEVFLRFYLQKLSKINRAPGQGHFLYAIYLSSRTLISDKKFFNIFPSCFHSNQISWQKSIYWTTKVRNTYQFSSTLIQWIRRFHLKEMSMWHNTRRTKDIGRPEKLTIGILCSGELNMT